VDNVIEIEGDLLPVKEAKLAIGKGGGFVVMVWLKYGRGSCEAIS